MRGLVRIQIIGATIDNILRASLSAATASVDGPEAGVFSPKGSIQPQAIPDTGKQAMFNLRVQKLWGKMTQQQQEIETFTAQLKEHTSQIQKINAELEVSKLVTKVGAKHPKAARRRDC
jgi:hypothetical protein